MSLFEEVFAKYNHTLAHTSPTHQEKNSAATNNMLFPYI